MRKTQQNRRRGPDNVESVVNAVRQQLPRLTDDARRGAARLTRAPRTALVATLLASFSLGALPAPGAHAREQEPAVNRAEQAEAKGRITASFMNGTESGDSARQAKQGARPAWVEDALARSLAHLQQRNAASGKREAAAEFALRRADQDDLGQIHMRLDQLQNGVPVYGGQLVAQLDADAVLGVAGREFDDARGVDTTPTLTPAEAVVAARAAMNTACVFAREPEAELVVLPRQLVDGKAGATLCYLVELLVEDGTEATGRHRYFVDARDGRIVWHYDAMAHGTGKSLYSGTVDIRTKFQPGDRIRLDKYLLQDDTRGNLRVIDARGQTPGFFPGPVMTDSNDVWGNGTTGDRQSAAVDAYFGAAASWDYFLTEHGWRGINNVGAAMPIVVHYGSAYNNAFWDGGKMAFGDGDGAECSPLVSLDIVGHEYTHAVTEETANLIYQNESGAANESFSDIFGTAIESFPVFDFEAFRLHYELGEDAYTPGTAGDAFRNMADPPAEGQPDHYSNRYRGTRDNGGVHINSGIQNKAFYLLAQGGTHPVSRIAVTGIGRAAAEQIFFRALTLKLTSSATFADVRAQTLGAAEDLYGPGSAEALSTARAWDAVGVAGRSPFNPAQLKVLYYASHDGSGAVGQVDENLEHTTLTSHPAGAFATEWTSIVSSEADLVSYRMEDGMAEVGNVDAGGNYTTVRSFPAGFFASGSSHVTMHEGNLLFYDEVNGAGAIGRLMGPDGFTQYSDFSIAPGWTHVVSVQGRLLFYDANTGLAEVCDLEEVFDGLESEFPRLVNVVLTNVSALQIAAGWSNIVDTTNGILFYNSNTGQYVVGDLDEAGNYADRVSPVSSSTELPLWEYGTAGEGWTHVVMVEDTLLFYSAGVGFAMTATVLTAAQSHEQGHEPLVKGTEFTLPSGWTHITASVDPLF
jgi:Zn-dependent metalloprotease